MELLNFIEDNNFHRYHDGRYYSSLLKYNKIEKGVYKTIYYTKEELLTLSKA
jgi:hypothetical protein